MVKIKLKKILMLYIGVVAATVITFTTLVSENVMENIDPTRALHIPSLVMNTREDHGLASNRIRGKQVVRIS